MTRLALVLIGAFIVVNLLFTWSVRSTGLVERPVDVQTRAIFDARLDGFFSKSSSDLPKTVFVGDSVVFGSKLRDAFGPGWEALTLPARYSAHRGESALNLGINGVLFSDLECVVREALERHPSRLVVNVSLRPFAADFAKAGNVSERTFLCEPPTFGDRLAGMVPLLRYRDLWQFGAFGTTPRQFLTDAVEVRVRPKDPFEDDDDDLDLEEILWKTKASNRLNSVDVNDTHVQSAHLDALMATLASHPEVDIVVLYLEEDAQVLGEQLDAERFQDQQQAFVDRLAEVVARTPHVTLVHAENGDFQGLYDDYVHLTASGYDKLAKVVHEAFEERSKGGSVD